MPILQLLIFGGIGLVAGVGSGLFGIGGGVIIVPLLIYFQGLEAKVASATSLIAMILPVGILGVWQYFKAGIVNSTHIKIGIAISLGMFFGAFFGSKISIALPTKMLSRGFALLLIYVSFRLWFQDGK
jgi:uncharacterized membrane protein YfcA